MLFRVLQKDSMSMEEFLQSSDSEPDLVHEQLPDEALDTTLVDETRAKAKNLGAALDTLRAVAAQVLASRPTQPAAQEVGADLMDFLAKRL